MCLDYQTTWMGLFSVSLICTSACIALRGSICLFFFFLSYTSLDMGKEQERLKSLLHLAHRI